jgi:cytochrome P450
VSDDALRGKKYFFGKLNRMNTHVEANLMEAALVAKELYTAAGLSDPYPIYEKLRQYGTFIGLGRQVFVFGYEECKSILSDDRFASPDANVRDRWMPGWQSESAWRSICTTMLFKNEPDHSRVRSFVSSWFTPKSVENLRETVNRAIVNATEDLAALAKEGNSVDVIPNFVDWVPLNVMCEMLGVPVEDRSKLLPLLMPVTTAFSASVDKSKLVHANAAIDELEPYFRELLQTRRKNPQNDLMSHLIKKHDTEHQVSEDELVATFLVLIIGGFAAPADFLGNLVALLAKHPEWAECMRNDEKLIPGFVEECLRYDPPAQLLNRVAMQDVTDYPVNISAGTMMLLVIAAANRDPRQFENPGTFNPERKIVQHLSFGMGAHYCLGFILARMQCQAVISELVKRFKSIEIGGTASYREQLLERGYQTLPLRLQLSY